ncbi:MAG: dinitrogenase iron-molybdenum cofactor biosynthesis protein [Desulfarculaceae bacterium]|nr:dinitrogenase iron-molybdenum cofactor biosynthesis protein [Desulfarculaceae bacterium]MCF8070943.1 dinitrogenase iron-molybdenum cofactor biosynthesis protein [Desulfarculaceae bacterium]MCF8100531.1 dinitrogenase iron-molybdenum cofactor biosynthesis protein [Desulfarculaceae bacterium]MCF8116557.1 dinitrogenase iron-molybdenum cofactor biosynthesis protein [Desulfarculaceae bacterium]
MIIAVPTEGSGGLDAKVSDHFGHSPAFALVPVNDNQLGEPQFIANGDHGDEGCMGPVNRLKAAGADAVAVGGLGARPLSGLQDVGIAVYHHQGAASVGDAVRLVLEGKAQRFAPAQACKGHGNCGGEGHAH